MSAFLVSNVLAFLSQQNQSSSSREEISPSKVISSANLKMCHYGKHAENVFGELFNEANTFYTRANSLQDRIDRLAVKVTQLDSSVEEGQFTEKPPVAFLFWFVFLQFYYSHFLLTDFYLGSCCFIVSLHDMNMRKAFRGSAVQDQQVLSKGSTPSSVEEMYDGCDKPPPLGTLTDYRCCK
ncbi:hypothetical protein GOODEAATRI_008192 [Goodea atripinnis]|uniref:Uncharacterized protein n=1 Tax=Goodea atripinnis TaxID=208336 RepID=A0ABV0NIJ6_9TELE